VYEIQIFSMYMSRKSVLFKGIAFVGKNDEIFTSQRPKMMTVCSKLFWNYKQRERLLCRI